MKPTITNPTDDQLNAAFAEHVAGMEFVGLAKVWVKVGVSDHAPVPNFTDSADAVLPWLEGGVGKHYGWSCRFMPSGGTTPGQYWITVGITSEAFHATDPVFSRAAVIALLRANGVEVMFK